MHVDKKIIKLTLKKIRQKCQKIFVKHEKIDRKNCEFAWTKKKRKMLCTWSVTMQASRIFRWFLRPIDQFQISTPGILSRPFSTVQPLEEMSPSQSISGNSRTTVRAPSTWRQVPSCSQVDQLPKWSRLKILFWIRIHLQQISKPTLISPGKTRGASLARFSNLS